MVGLQPSSSFVLNKVKGEILPNLAFFGIGLLLIIFFGAKFRIIGLIGFWLYAIIFIVDVVGITISLGSGIIILFAPKTSKYSEQKTLWFATLIKFIEFFVFAFYTYSLYIAFVSKT